MGKDKGLFALYNETAKWKHMLQNRIKKQQAFFSRKEKGDILLHINRFSRGIPYLTNYFYNLLSNKEVIELLQKKSLEDITFNYLQQLRYSLFSFYAIEDDALPALIEIFFHIGVITSSMTGGKVVFSNQTNWCKHQLNWEEIQKLKFNSENPWILFTRGVYQALWKFWDEDFLIGVYVHRSPLDAAWGILGQSIFEYMYTEPEKVKYLVNWCCEWSISLENFLYNNLEFEKGYTGTNGTLLPDRAVVVNGDPIDLIKSDFAKIFDLPYSSKFFSTFGGGFYHHHSKGLFQVPLITKINGLVIQQIMNDYPSTVDLAETIINNDVVRENIIKSSHIAPIQLDMIPYRFISELIPVLKEGRFIIEVICENHDDAKDCIKKINKINNLK